jgi:spermidine/putrescine transport system substrate-binding protein
VTGLIIGVAGCSLAYAEEKVLNIYTWASYVPDKVVQQFERETGIRVNHSTYASNEVLYAKLKANPTAAYDIIIPSTYFINRMINNDLLQKIDRTKLSHLKNVNPIFLDKEHDPKNEYGVPYLWNATGIAVNKKAHNADNIRSWQDLWAPAYKDELLLVDDAREVFSTALLVLGLSVNDTKLEAIDLAFQKLKKLLPNVKLFNTDAQKTIYLDEDITLGMGWNGDIYLASLENAELSFIYPTEGFIVALDCLAIPRGARHVEYAHQFIDFILRAEVAEKISMITGFPTANIAAFHLLPEAVRNNPILYPNHSTMKRGFLLMDVGKAAAVYEKYYVRLKLE